MLDKLLPFPLRRAVEFEPERLADHCAQIYDLDATLVVEDAYDIMIWMAQWRKGLPVTVTGDGDKASYRAFQVSSVTYRLVYVPIWVARFRQRDSQRLVLINGVTGRVAIGEANLLGEA